jgi:putative DNA primase/helicase
VAEQKKDGGQSIRERIEERRAAEDAVVGGDSGHQDAGDGITSEFIQQCARSRQLGDGLLFAALHRGRYVFNKQTREWLVFNGAHWELDELDTVKAAVEDVIDVYDRERERLWNAWYQANRDEDKEEARRLKKLVDLVAKKVNSLRDDNGRNKCLEFAHTMREQPLHILGDELDADPWLLGCANGVLDLRTGLLREGRAEDYILKASPTKWEGIDAPREAWEKSVLEIMHDDEEMAAYIRRLFGYACFGVAPEHVFAVLHGQGRNGKSYMVETIQDVLGEVAGPIPAEMLLDQGVSRSSSGPTPDIMALRGRRLAFASETDEGRKFSASRVKWFSGGDSLTGRYGYGNMRMIAFKPSHQLFLLTNHKPHASADDFAFWERMHLIPFELSFVKRPPRAENERPVDLELGEKVRAERSGILAWLVQGCLEWQEQGLNPPAKVLEATAEYRRDEDLLADFVDECCYVPDPPDPGVWVGATEIYDVFCWWFSKTVSRKKSIPHKIFGKLMKSRFESVKSGTYRYNGVGILAEVLEQIEAEKWKG